MAEPAPQSGAPSGTGSVAIPRLIGRGQALRSLTDVVLGTSDHPAAVVEAPAGRGKTTLLHAVALGAADAGVRVRQAAASQVQRAVPYALVTDLFALSARVAHADLLDPYGRVLRVTEQVVDLLGGDGQPTAIIVDDLHWADPASLAVIGRLLHRTPSLGVPLALASRPSTRTEVTDLLAEARALGARTIGLDPLTSEASLALAAEELGAHPGPLLAELVDGAAGNPLFIVELARSLRAGDDLVRDGDTVDVRSRQLPASLRDRVARAVDVLPEPTQAALRAAAILGTRVDLAALASFSSTSVLRTHEHLRPALTAGLLEEGADGMAFRHDLVRTALYEGMAPAIRGSLHREAAAALTDPVAAAAHLETAGPPYSVDELNRLIDAATSIRGTDGDRARELLELVLSELPADDPSRDTLRVEYARALAGAGQARPAADVLAGLAEEGATTDIDTGLAVLAAQAGRDAPDPKLVARLVASTRALSDREERLNGLGVLAYHAVRAGPTTFHALFPTLPLDEPDLPWEAHVHFLLAQAAVVGREGDIGQAAEIAARAHQMAVESAPGSITAIRSGLTLGPFGGDITQMRQPTIDALRQVTRWAEDAGQAGLVPAAHALLANALWSDGDWDAATAAYETARDAAREARVPRWEAESLSQLTIIAADRGEAKRAWALLGQCLESVRRLAEPGDDSGPLITGTGRSWVSVNFLEGQIYYGAGQDEEAIAAWSRELGDPKAAPFAKAVVSLDLLVVALASGRRDVIAFEVECLEPFTADGPPMGWSRQLVTAAVEGDLDVAVAIAEEGELAPVPAQGTFAEVAGLIAKDVGRDDIAIAWLQRAQDHWARCGTPARLSRSAAWLRELGVRTRGEIRPRPATGWEALTDAETRVVEQVAEGLLYREVGERLHISRRTVETHVASALRKLGLRNRSELAAGWWTRTGSP